MRSIAPLWADWWELQVIVAQLEGDWPAARLALEQLDIWRQIAGVGRG